MDEKTKIVESQRRLILDARKRGKLATLGAWCKLSGPGWMQSATTLGGGSLASALYLGVLGGFGFMWLQPIAMILGIVMLAAISYVTLSISDRPMHAINKNISPILGYGWAGASMLSCIVFAMPQFSLGVAAIEQNIAPGLFTNPFYSEIARIIITVCLFAIAITMVVLYAKGGKGIKIFEIFIKASVAAIVLCFFGVVFQLTYSGAINWNAVFAGFVPNFSVFSEPSADFMAYISKLGGESAKFWSDMIVSQQRDVVISAAAMAVGINMTFLFPYSMLKKGWNKDFRELAIFDLATGLFIPFLLATSCIVVASASQFHAKPASGLDDAQWTAVAPDNLTSEMKPVLMYSAGKWESWMKGTPAESVLCISAKQGVENYKFPASNLIKPYIQLLDMRLASIMGSSEFAGLNIEQKCEKYTNFDFNERRMAAMLVKRDASNLSETLAPLVGDDVARYIFGFGVLGMSINAVLMNVLICGLSFCEVFGKFGSAKWQIIGSLLIVISALGSLFFEGAKMWFVIYSGVIAMVLLPIAYGAFLLIMNSSRIMGESKPRGLARVIWNTLMACSLFASSVASLWVLWNKLQLLGISLFVAFLIAVVISSTFVSRRRKA